MDAPLGIEKPFDDARDDFRNGFVAGVTHARGQLHPTQAQVLDALGELAKFRAASDILPERLADTSGHSQVRRLPRS